MKIAGYQLSSIETGYLSLDGGAMFGTVPKALWLSAGAVALAPHPGAAAYHLARRGGGPFEGCGGSALGAVFALPGFGADRRR